MSEIKTTYSTVIIMTTNHNILKHVFMIHGYTVYEYSILE